MLLFFIERDELDIYDIPIANITDEFLDYIRTLESMNIDLASEFILVAATLCRIKARLLLPRRQIDEEGNEIDPRDELVQRLLEYKRYKSVLDEMVVLEELRSSRESRGNVTKELRQIASIALVDVELENLTLFKLLKTFERMVRQMEGNGSAVVQSIVRFNYNISQQQEYILSNLSKGKKANFQSIFKSLENRIHAIVTFLALLELLNMQRLKITQRLGVNNFWIELNHEYKSGE